MRRITIASALVILLSSIAFAASPAGKYTGTWTGQQSQGNFKIALTPGTAQGEWNAQVSFTLGEVEVPCKTAYVKIDGDKVELAYDFEVSGFTARSTVVGTIKGSDMEGKYTTKASDGSAVDEGTWKV